MQEAAQARSDEEKRVVKLSSDINNVSAYVDAFKRGDVDEGQLRWILDKAGLVDAYRDENGSLHVIPKPESAELYGLSGDSAGYFVRSGGGGIIVRPEYAEIDKRSVDSHQIKVHESRHAEQHLAGGLGSYSPDTPWGDRPSELDAERAVIEDYKQRLEASGIKYTPEMGYRFLQMHKRNKIVTPESQAPLREPVRNNPSGGKLSYGGKKMSVDDIERNIQSEIGRAEKLIKFGGFDATGKKAKKHRDDYKTALLRLRAAKQ